MKVNSYLDNTIVLNNFIVYPNAKKLKQKIVKYFSILFKSTFNKDKTVLTVNKAKKPSATAKIVKINVHNIFSIGAL